MSVGAGRGRARRRILAVVVVLVALGLPALTAARSQAAGTPSKVTVSPSTVFVAAIANAGAPVSATVRDNTNKALANIPVAWSNDGGATFSSSTTLTNAQGVASTNVLSDGGWGHSTITARAATATGTGALVEYGAPSNLVLTLQPSSLPPDGTSTSLATLRVTDNNQNPDPVPGLQVSMSTNGDVRIGAVVDHGDGTYAATITASTTPGTETITAIETSPSTQLSTTAPLSEYGAATTVAVSLSPPHIPATGTSTSVATATVRDANGALVPNEAVTFAASGNAGIGAVTNHNDGTYTATVTSTLIPGTQTITARATHANTSGTATLTQTFGALHVSDNQVVDVNGTPVVLQGVHRDGLEVRTQTYDPNNKSGGYATSHPITEDEIQHAADWNASVVRVPLSEDFWNQSCAAYQTTNNSLGYRYDPNYRGQVAQVVKWITDRGMVALLDLHTTQRQQCDSTHNQRLLLPDQSGAVAFWQSLVPAFGSNPLVAFELYNEPHVCIGAAGIGYGAGTTNCQAAGAAASGLWRDGGTVSSGNVLYTAAGMSTLYGAVQGALNALPPGSPSHLVFVDGNGWAGDPTPFSTSGQFPMFTGTNLVYAEHLYRCPHLISEDGQTATDCENDPTNSSCTTLAGVIDHFQTTDVSEHPVVLDEFGWPNDSQSTYMQNIVSHLHAVNRGFIGFAWDGWVRPPTTTDTWALLGSLTPGPDDATASGQPLKDAMSGIYPTSC